MIRDKRAERITAKLNALGFPALPAELTVRARINSLDGLMFPTTAEWRAHMDALIRLGRMDRWNAFANHGETAYASARERCAWQSCQVVLHRIDGEEWGEADCDHFNPDRGAAPAFLHLIVDVGWLSLKRAWRKKVA